MSNISVRFRPKGVKTSVIDPEIMIALNFYVGKSIVEISHRCEGKVAFSSGYLTDLTSEYLSLGKSPTLSNKDLKIPFKGPGSYIISICALGPAGEKIMLYKNQEAFLQIPEMKLSARN